MITVPNQTYHVARQAPQDEDPEHLRNALIRFVMSVVLMAVMAVVGMFGFHFLLDGPW